MPSPLGSREILVGAHLVAFLLLRIAMYLGGVAVIALEVLHLAGHGPGPPVSSLWHLLGGSQSSAS